MLPYNLMIFSAEVVAAVYTNLSLIQCSPSHFD